MGIYRLEFRTCAFYFVNSDENMFIFVEFLVSVINCIDLFPLSFMVSYYKWEFRGKGWNAMASESLVCITLWGGFVVYKSLGYAILILLMYQVSSYQNKLWYMPFWTILLLEMFYTLTDHIWLTRMLDPIQLYIHWHLFWSNLGKLCYDFQVTSICSIRISFLSCCFTSFICNNCVLLTRLLCVISVSVSVTDTEVKFSAVNEEVIYRTEVISTIQ